MAWDVDTLSRGHARIADRILSSGKTPSLRALRPYEVPPAARRCWAAALEPHRTPAPRYPICAPGNGRQLTGSNLDLRRLIGGSSVRRRRSRGVPGSRRRRSPCRRSPRRRGRRRSEPSTCHESSLIWIWCFPHCRADGDDHALMPLDDLTILEHRASVAMPTPRLQVHGTHNSYADGSLRLPSPLMDVTTTVRGRVLVGPNGMSRPVPRSATVTVTGKDPYDLDIRLNWDDDEQRLVPEDVRITRRAEGIPVRVAELARLRLGETIAASLAARCSTPEDGPASSRIIPTSTLPPSTRSSTPWPTRSAATTQPRSSAWLAGCSPARPSNAVMRARERGHLGEAHKGRSGGLSGLTPA